MFGRGAVVGSGLIVVMKSCQVVFEPSGCINSGAVRGCQAGWSQLQFASYLYLSERGPAVTLG